MISKSFEKYINSLKFKKYRSANHRFIAEGEKTVQEFLNEKFPIEKIIALPEWTSKNARWKKKYEIEEVSAQVMDKLSSLTTPSPVLMVGKIQPPEYSIQTVSSSFHLALDGINDPGNLGTIIRIADWFRIEYVFCSEDCADAFNPKTVQSSMGSLARVKVIEMKLQELFTRFKQVPVYGAFMNGISIYDHEKISTGFLLIGNEAHGISSSLTPFIKERIGIPRMGKAESLNAAVAAGIMCALLRR